MNTVCVMGRLVADPELKTTQNGLPVTSFTVAVDRWVGGEQKADFFPVVAWKKTAEFIVKNFHKGKMIAIEGVLRSRKYEDKNGNNRTVIEIMANKVSFCGDKSGDKSGDESGDKQEFGYVGEYDDLPF